MTKVSVIVPVYNVELYLDRCLNSLVNQTLKDIEIIIVNDGSPDNSQKIIDAYANKYSNIKSYKKKNGGLSDARNYGLEFATGDYITFVDSDDYINEKMMEIMYEKALEKDFDLVVCNVKSVDEDDKTIRNISSNINNDIFDNDIKQAMVTIYPVAWNKMYKRKLFNNNIYFKKGVWFEDVEFIYRLFPYINSIGTIKEELYYYVQHDGAITKTFDKRLYNYIDNWNGIIKFYKDKGIYNLYKDELEYCYARYLYATFIKRATNFKYHDYIKAVNVAIKNVKINFPKYRKNKYLNIKNAKNLYIKYFNKLIANILFLLKLK